MCRMVAAVGSFAMADVVEGVRAMATNANPAHQHELSPRAGAFLHDSGWGAVYLRDGHLERVRSTTPCFEDRLFDELAGVETDLAVVHARRAKHPRSIAPANTHPFLVTHRDAVWAFCHNGEVRDTSQLSWDPSLAPEGSTDSERLFLHVLSTVAMDGPSAPDALAATLGRLRDFTCVNCLVVRSRSVVYATRREPGSTTPRYYTMWRTDGQGPAGPFAVVSSEVLPSPVGAWTPVEDGSASFLACSA
ncbi:MAG: class II glutamine amidotransferase [Candidatus Eisenbacteria bacterium]|nr:class II glutamine amidotransferase [Candidatus Eisenbacteria bacterium]